MPEGANSLDASRLTFLRSRRLQLLIATVAGGATLVLVLILATGGGDSGGLRILPGPVPEERLAEDPTIDRGERASEDVAEADSLEAFVREHGEPAGTDFARLRIPAIGVNAPVGLHVIDGSDMPEPFGPVDVAAYNFAAWPEYGGLPGEGRNTVFAGHVDLNRDIPYAGGAHYRGPAIFWDLDRLRPGDLIEVDYLGETYRYAVLSIESLDAHTTEWGAIWSANVEVETITLFTCGGAFDRASASYSDRVVVRAERV